jgi:hypothetical protein
MLIFNLPNIIKVFYEEENDLLIHEWLDYNPEGQDEVILEIIQKLYDILLTHPVEKVIVRTNQTRGAFSPRILNYLENIQMPRVESNTKLRYAVTIQSKETMKIISASLWQGQLGKVEKMMMHDVESEEEAREWLKNFD